MPPDHRIPILRTTLVRLLNDIDLIRSRVYRLGTRPSIHQQTRRRSLERRYGMRVGYGLGYDFEFGIVRSGDLRDIHEGLREIDSYPDIEFETGFGEEGKEGDSLPPTPPIPSRSRSPSSSPAAGAGSKHKDPEVHFRGGGYSREYAGKHGTPNITRAPPGGRNAGGGASRGARRSTRRVRPGRSDEVSEEIEENGSDWKEGEDGTETEVEEGREGIGDSEGVSEDKGDEGSEDGKGENDGKGKGKERVV